ncbi:MAG: hypothetical protein LUD22_00645 [Coprobacillus sp.]|nr:hypothetical protein [Coprobacillus sp.]
MGLKDIKLEERSEDEPKFNRKNKTDRRIVIMLVSILAVVILLLVAFVLIYYLVL